MFLEIFRFELKYALKKPSTYVFFAIYFAFYLFLSLVASGIIPLGSSDSNTYLNSASANAGLYLAFNQNILALIHNMIIIDIMATAIQRDFEFNSHSLFFTKPIPIIRFCSLFISNTNKLDSGGIICPFGSGVG